MKRRTLSFTLLLVALVSFSFVNPPVRAKKSAKKAAGALVFPVAGKASNIRDKWGASRGGGTRKHKGIDIHARKGTAVVAVSDGVIVTRNTTPVGGKTLWLKSAGQPWTAYYAHLDKQLVKRGQFVRKGQVIGTVGNTGNARTTPSHLHFGIVTSKGWVNPLPIVRNSPKVIAPVPSKSKTPVSAKNVKNKAKKKTGKQRR